MRALVAAFALTACFHASVATPPEPARRTALEVVKACGVPHLHDYALSHPLELVVMEVWRTTCETYYSQTVCDLRACVRLQGAEAALLQEQVPNAESEKRDPTDKP